MQITLNKEKCCLLIPSIQSAERKIVSKLQDITEVFRKYIYTDLYTSTCDAGDSDIRDFFLYTLNLPKLTEQQKSELDSPITTEEIVEVIRSLPSSKSPGLNGFTAEFFFLMLCT